MIEAGTITRLPDNPQERIFENCYQSPSFVLITTTQCPQDLFHGIANRLESDSLDWLTPIGLPTSRQLFLGRLAQSGKPLSPDIIFKKSRYEPLAYDPPSFGPGSTANEIRTNLVLSSLIERLTQTESLPPPGDFGDLSVQVEKPLGILVDKKTRAKYSMFAFKSGFDSGEVLQYTEPPIEGAVFYNPRDWRIFGGIKDVLNTIIKAASQEGLDMRDYDIHQVLYRTGSNDRSLELVLVDSERFKLRKV